MCFRPSEVGGIEHRCPECGTNNLPEATMCANCFAPLEPLDLEALALGAVEAPSAPPQPPAPAASGAPKAPGAPNAPKPPMPPKAPAPHAAPQPQAAPEPAPSPAPMPNYGESLSPTATFGAVETKADEPGVGEIFSF